MPDIREEMEEVIARELQYALSRGLTREMNASERESRLHHARHVLKTLEELGLTFQMDGESIHIADCECSQHMIIAQ